MSNIFTIIVTYNGIEWIEKCLTSVRSSAIQTHIIVVDNMSSDGTVDYVRTNFPEVELICPKKNLGFGKGNNIALKMALDQEADYVFLLNQDAWVESSTIEKLIEIHMKNEDFGILSPLHLGWDASHLEYYFSTIIGPLQCPTFIEDIYKGELKEIYPISFIHGAAWLLSKKALNQIGGFNPLFEHYCEDLEYVNRLKQNGLKIGIVPESIVMHKGTHQGLKDFSEDLYLNYHFSLVDFLNNQSKLLVFYLIFTKTTFDKITSALLFRKWKVLSTQLKLFAKISFNLRKIALHRKLALKTRAFLK